MMKTKMNKFIEVSFKNYRIIILCCLVLISPLSVSATIKPDTTTQLAVDRANLEFHKQFQSLNRKNIKNFFTTWNEISLKYGQTQKNPALDSIVNFVFNRYINWGVVLSDYIVFPTWIEVSYFDMNGEELGDKEMRYDSNRAQINYVYIPHLELPSHNIVYLYPSVEKCLKSYLDKNGELLRCYEVSKKQERNLQLLSEYMYYHYGHWTDWDLETVPSITKINIFNDGTYVHIRESWYTGVNLFIPKGKNEFKVTFSWSQ